MKKGQSNVVVKKASMYQEKKSKKVDDDESPKDKCDKLINVIYNEGEYYLYEGKNKEANKFNIIDNHLWYITKFMPNVNVVWT